MIGIYAYAYVCKHIGVYKPSEFTKSIFRKTNFFDRRKWLLYGKPSSVYRSLYTPIVRQSESVSESPRVEESERQFICPNLLSLRHCFVAETTSTTPSGNPDHGRRRVPSCSAAYLGGRHPLYLHGAAHLGGRGWPLSLHHYYCTVIDLRLESSFFFNIRNIFENWEFRREDAIQGIWKL